MTLDGCVAPSCSLSRHTTRSPLPTANSVGKAVRSRHITQSTLRLSIRERCAREVKEWGRGRGRRQRRPPGTASKEGRAVDRRWHAPAPEGVTSPHLPDVISSRPSRTHVRPGILYKQGRDASSSPSTLFPNNHNHSHRTTHQAPLRHVQQPPDRRRPQGTSTPCIVNVVAAGL